MGDTRITAQQHAAKTIILTTDAALEELRIAAGPHRHLAPMVNAVIKALQAERQFLIGEWSALLAQARAILDRTD